ncbi:MAG: YnbE family lipoprotein [Alphaproteobacteria bacterium]|nr:YnbE family lipoprotein [Alphaproteobacteria bacterium]
MTHSIHSRLVPLCGLLMIGYAAAACTPTVKVETPDKPITINLNVNISHEIRVKVDKDLENTFEENSSIF